MATESEGVMRLAAHVHPTPAIADAIAGISRRSAPLHRVVIVGGGFGGLRAVRALRHAPVAVTLIDKRNFHLFEPLLYQVATGALSAAEVATPLRGIVKRQRNARVLLGEVVDVDVARRRLVLGGLASGSAGGEVPYDSLIVAAGAQHAYFGHDEWEERAPGLKTLEDALELRRRLLLAFEAAEEEPDAARRAAWLTFVVVGGGPTGVEMAGQIAEIARETLPRDFRAIDPREARVVVVEMGDRPLRMYHPHLSEAARRSLNGLGVSVRTGSQVVDIDDQFVTVMGPDGGRERVETRTIVWAAGVQASGLGALLARATGAPLDRSGRVGVEADLTLPGHPEVFVLGDMVSLADPRTGRPLPGVAPVAMQQGRFAAATIVARLRGGERPGAFRYRDKGDLATIGRGRAVAQIGPVRMAGLPAWLAWVGIHLVYLVGVQNRLIVLTRWSIGVLTGGRGARVIWSRGATGSDPEGPAREAQAGVATGPGS